MSSAEIHLRHSAKKVRDYTVDRDEQVRLLRAEGYTLRALAEMTKLSHTAIAKICAR